MKKKNNLLNLFKIEFKYVKGIKSKFIDFSKCFIKKKIINTPIILLSENGSGKSSIAETFSLINNNKIKIPEKYRDFYGNNINNLPEIIFSFKSPDKKILDKKI